VSAWYTPSASCHNSDSRSAKIPTSCPKFDCGVRLIAGPKVARNAASISALTSDSVFGTKPAGVTPYAIA
jgi:hypothetical protein